MVLMVILSALAAIVGAASLSNATAGVGALALYDELSGGFGAQQVESNMSAQVASIVESENGNLSDYRGTATRNRAPPQSDNRCGGDARERIRGGP